MNIIYMKFYPSRFSWWNTLYFCAWFYAPLSTCSRLSSIDHKYFLPASNYLIYSTKKSQKTLTYLSFRCLEKNYVCLIPAISQAGFSFTECINCTLMTRSSNIYCSWRQKYFPLRCVSLQVFTITIVSFPPPPPLDSYKFKTKYKNFTAEIHIFPVSIYEPGGLTKAFWYFADHLCTSADRNI